MFDELLFAAIASAALLGGMLFRAARAERRRARFEPRLRALIRAEPSTGRARSVVAAAVPATQGLAGRSDGPARATLAGAGNRIRPLHLAATAGVAAAAVALMAATAELRPALAIALATAAACAAPALLFRLVKSPLPAAISRDFPRCAGPDRSRRQGRPSGSRGDRACEPRKPAPGRHRIRRMLNELRIGTDMEDAFQRAAERVRDPDFQFFIVSLLLQRQTGGGIADTLANLSTIIRQRKALRQKARALSAEAQASAAIVATTPFIGGVGLFIVNRELMSVLITDPRGRFMLGLAIAGLLSGIVAMRVLIQRNMRSHVRDLD